jgi:hypothetical protein
MNLLSWSRIAGKRARFALTGIPRKDQFMSMEKPRNPFILTFLAALIRRKGLTLSEEVQAQEVDRMYQLLETMLGRKLVAQLPEDKKAYYERLCTDLSQLDLTKVAEIFGDRVPDPQGVMKETLQEFCDIYLKNR